MLPAWQESYLYITRVMHEIDGPMNYHIYTYIHFVSHIALYIYI